MMVLKRKEGQWAEVIHAESGDVIRIRVCQIEADRDWKTANVNLVFDDDERNFEIVRPERKVLRERES